MRNCKKSFILKNNTKYFIPGKDKVFVTCPSDNTYNFKRLKVESFEARLYWQFRFCQSVGCDVYFYTLTYADKNVPSKYGVNCFDYYDLRDLLTGGFRKQLLRKYGLTFKYFVGAELGEGKGSRGFENNPHYHILFFLEPANNPAFPLKKITSLDFRHLVRIYWQGFDEDFGFKSYKYQTKYGIAKEGENIGLVTDFRAISYCSKYVLKDVSLRMKEVDIIKLIRMRTFYQLQDDLDFHKRFFKEVVKPSFFASFVSDNVAFQQLLPSLCEFASKIPDMKVSDLFCNDQTFIKDVKLLCSANKFWKEYYNFLNSEVDERVRLAINEWRNRYSNKARISHNCGVFGIDFIEDLYNPKIMVPSKKGLMYRSLPLYYYRKLYTGIVSPNETFYNGKVYKAKPVRVLNRLGIDFRLRNLETQISKKSDKIKSLFSVLSEDIFNDAVNSDINISVRCSYLYFQDRLSFILKFINCKDLSPLDTLFRIYSEYKLVYEGRFFHFNGEFPKISLYDDFERFLQPSVFSIERSDLSLDAFIDCENPNYMSYEDHPYFLPYSCVFAVFDLITDYFFIQKDNVFEAKNARKEDVRKFHAKREFKSNL